ncbi:MAG TPA: M48 family metalloprotease [Parvibaculum sp.]|jgi:predicted Zn-dependent protease
MKAATPIRKMSALWLSAVLAFAGAVPAHAEGISLVRDAETEQMIRDYAVPIWRAAGLVPSAVHVHLVNDPTINAFVAGGQRLFINTGLISQADAPMELIGVIAHETGHMAGGHLARGQEAMSKMALPYYASMLAGFGAIIAGAGDAGMAILAGGAQVAQRSILSYSRQQEGSADQAGATYLERSGQSGKGMLLLFEKFRDQEALSTTSQDPFIRSHPISEDRLASLEERVKASPYFDKPDPPERIHHFKMVQAKLNGFVDDPETTFRRYPPEDHSDYAHYARSVAYHKAGDTDKSLGELAPLLKKEPTNPFLWELSGQIKFESGKVAESVPDYRRAHSLLPEEPQLQLELATALLAVDSSDLNNKALDLQTSSNKDAGLAGSNAPPPSKSKELKLVVETNDVQISKEALSYLLSSVKIDSENPLTFYQLAIAYGRLNKIGLAELSTAQYYEAVGAMKDARMHAAKAQRMLKTGSPEWLRAQDIATAHDPMDERG